MARPKGVRNKIVKAPSTLELSMEERIKLLANLILDKMEADPTMQAMPKKSGRA